MAFRLKYALPAARGVSLMELCIAMMVMSVLSIGVASIIRAGVESQQNERMYNTMHLVANNLITDLRFDLTRAYDASITNAGMDLNIVDENGGTVRYQVFSDPTAAASGVNSIRRVDPSGAAKIYNKIGAVEYRPALRITCDPATVPGSASAACFQGFLLQESPAGSGTFAMVSNLSDPTQIQISDISFYSPDYAPGTDRSYLQSFGVARYRLRGSTFDVLSNLQFN